MRLGDMMFQAKKDLSLGCINYYLLIPHTRADIHRKFSQKRRKSSNSSKSLQSIRKPWKCFRKSNKPMKILENCKQESLKIFWKSLENDHEILKNHQLLIGQFQMYWWSSGLCEHKEHVCWRCMCLHSLKSVNFILYLRFLKIASLGGSLFY